MNRIIKFRGWDEKHKKMWSPEEMGADELTLNPDGRGFVNVSGDSTWQSHYVSHIMPLQFTGLHDKNGKEIYEGDLLKTDALTPCEVIFRNGHFAIKDELSEKIGDCPLIFGLKGEVIGNIFEHSHLLKEPHENKP